MFRDPVSVIRRYLGRLALTAPIASGHGLIPSCLSGGAPSKAIHFASEEGGLGKRRKGYLFLYSTAFPRIELTL